MIKRDDSCSVWGNALNTFAIRSSSSRVKLLVLTVIASWKRWSKQFSTPCKKFELWWAFQVKQISNGWFSFWNLGCLWKNIVGKVKLLGFTIIVKFFRSKICEPILFFCMFLRRYIFLMNYNSTMTHPFKSIKQQVWI